MAAAFKTPATGTSWEHGPTARLEGPELVRPRHARITARLALHGLALPPGRFARFLDLNDDYAARRLGPAKPGHTRDLGDLIEGMRDFAELATVVEHLVPPAPPMDPALVTRLRRSLGGAPLPVEDSDSRARDAQFELYVAAVCRQAGISVELAEPDAIVTTAGVPFGVAAKRVRSAKKVLVRVKEAGAQVRAIGLPGIVALSLDGLLDPPFAHVAARSVVALRQAPRELLRTTLERHKAQILAGARGTRLVALLASLVVPGMVPPGNLVGRLAALSVEIIASPTPREERALRELAERLAGRPPLV